MKNQNSIIDYHEIIISEDFKGLRIDQILAQLLPQYSRTRLQRFIKSGHVWINDQVCLAKNICEGGEKVSIKAVHEKETAWQAVKNINIEAISIYQDQDILIINKPVGLVVHPGAGNAQNTLANALLDYLPDLANVPRAGIVHRLDKDTSGLLIIAKTVQAHTQLVNQMQKREIQREYCALVIGPMISGGTITAPVGRHPIDRKKRAVNLTGKSAVTHYRVIERFRAHTLIRVILETGRTHQIRVHMAYKKYPLAGDSLYGARAIIPKYANEKLIQAIRAYKHQALHAAKLIFNHPVTQLKTVLEAPIPDDMEKLIFLLRANAQEHD